MAYNPNGGLDQNTYNDRAGSVGQWFKQYTGRDASDDDLNRAYADNFGNVENDIRGSDEAKAWAAKNQPQAAAPQQFDRNAFRDEWMGSGNNVGAQDAILKKYGITLSANGTGTLPSGEIMDLRRGARAGDNTAQWMGVGEVHNGVSSYYSGNPAATSGAGPNMPPGPPQNQHDPKWDALYDQLMKRSTQSLNVDPNDPIVRGQTDAFSAQQERARRDFLGEQAESNGPYGTGAQLGQARMTAEKLGQNTAGFQAQLMGRELESRRQEISQALSQMGGMLTEDQRMALQRELGYLNDATQRYGINESAATSRYGIDSAANTAANRLGLDYGNSQADYWLRSQGL